ncbi:hypothetical protein glysoja_000417 [Glycine soja]|nr:hypothetical protein glysoja_000417 [Glycine soja]
MSFTTTWISFKILLHKSNVTWIQTRESIKKFHDVTRDRMLFKPFSTIIVHWVPVVR